MFLSFSIQLLYILYPLIIHLYLRIHLSWKMSLPGSSTGALGAQMWMETILRSFSGPDPMEMDPPGGPDVFHLTEQCSKPLLVDNCGGFYYPKNIGNYDNKK